MQFPHAGPATIHGEAQGARHVFDIRVEPGSGTLEVKNVAAEIAGTRGEVKLSQIAGRVEVSHRGGEVTIEDAGSLDFNGRADR